MSHVGFQKWQYPLPLFLQFPLSNVHVISVTLFLMSNKAGTNLREGGGGRAPGARPLLLVKFNFFKF